MKEAGIDIYKEYLCKWVDAGDHDARSELNEKYLFKGEKIEKDFGLFALGGLYQEFTRAPKMHNINGHEVVAPRFESAKNGELIYVYFPFSDDGIKAVRYKPNMIFTCSKSGFFYDKSEALAYVKALRGDNND